ncbi:MAG: PTS glucose transporter subunit IIA [Eubacterium sp.]|nr:PTS glucose transporter subunit IIA [Eubacterium sp.]
MGIFDRFKKGSQSPVQSETQALTDPKAVYLPMSGKVIDLKEVGDGVFSEGMLGRGAAVEPSDEKVYAPFDGEVTMVYDTKHALGLMSKGGVELLIHIGLDTVNLEGKCFNIKVKNGQKIKTGDLLATADLKGIKNAGYRTVTPVIVTNSDDYEQIESVCNGSAEAGAKLLNIK